MKKQGSIIAREIERDIKRAQIGKIRAEQNRKHQEERKIKEKEGVM